MSKAISKSTPTPASKADNCDVILTETGSKKIGVIKAIREVLPGIDLKEAKLLSEQTPAFIKGGLSMEEAKAIADKFTAMDAKVQIDEQGQAVHFASEKQSKVKETPNEAFHKRDAIDQ